MKFTFSILFALATLFSCSHKSTLYCTAPNFSTWCFEFKPNNEFHYDFGTCTGSSYGYGKYEISGDTVRFKYDNIPDLQLSKIEVNKIESLNDSIHIDLTVSKFDSNIPIPGCTIAIYRDWKLEQGLETDFDGNAKIALGSNELGYEIRLSYVGLENYKFKTSKSGSYEIKVNLHSISGHRKMGYIEEYRLLELSDSLFSYSIFGDSLHVTKLFIKEDD